MQYHGDSGRSGVHVGAKQVLNPNRRSGPIAAVIEHE